MFQSLLEFRFFLNFWKILLWFYYNGKKIINTESHWNTVKIKFLQVLNETRKFSPPTRGFFLAPAFGCKRWGHSGKTNWRKNFWETFFSGKIFFGNFFSWNFFFWKIIFGKKIFGEIFSGNFVRVNFFWEIFFGKMLTPSRMLTPPKMLTRKNFDPPKILTPPKFWPHPKF